MVEALGDARGIRHCFVAGAGALSLAQLHIDDGLNGIQTEALPAILDLDVGQSEAVLQRAGHLQSTMLAHTGLGATHTERRTLETCARRKTLLATSSCSAMVEQLQEQIGSGDQRLILSGSCLTAAADGETPWAWS